MPTPTNDQPFPFRLDFPPELPISVRAGEITDAIQAHQVVILAGETGSGKTTQIPKMCLAAGRGMRGRIACTQPRRVAALSISRRVAEELGVDWGREVGCKIRFNDQTTPQTVGQLALVSFVNPAGLEPKGQNLYTETAASGTPTAGTPGLNGLGALQQGFVETSNVNVVEELVGMIQTQRAYELNSKAIQTSDQMLQRLAQL